MSTSGEINLDVIIYIIYYNIKLHYIHNKREAAIYFSAHITSVLAISVLVGIYYSTVCKYLCTVST